MSGGDEEVYLTPEELEVAHMRIEAKAGEMLEEAEGRAAAANEAAVRAKGEADMANALLANVRSIKDRAITERDEARAQAEVFRRLLVQVKDHLDSGKLSCGSECKLPEQVEAALTVRGRTT